MNTPRNRDTSREMIFLKKFESVVLLSVVLLWEMAACGGATSAVLTDDGDLFTFGRGGDGKLGVGDTRGR